MRHKKMIVGLFAAMMLVSASAASAQLLNRSGPAPLTSSAAVPEGFVLWLSPDQVQAGGTIQVEVQSRAPLDSACGGRATSPGFVAPIELSFSSHTVHKGEGRVITKPGVYRATVPCISGGSLTQTFVIIGGPSTTTPAKPPRKVVTPVGPPQTGGGGTS